MLRGDPVTAPPEKPVLEGRIIEKRFRYILSFHIIAVPPVLQRPQEEKRAIAVVIRRELPVSYRISVQFPINISDLFISPSFDRRSQPYSDDLRQPSGINLFYIRCFHEIPSTFFQLYLIYPLTLPLVIPSINRRLKNRYSITTGAIVITLAV